MLDDGFVTPICQLVETNSDRNMMKQSIESQMGEVQFRKKLRKQQIEGKCIFHDEDEYDTKGIETLLSERMEKTVKQMTRLKEAGVVLSPYVEIGAERCQRSLVMENDMSCTGAAVDISYDMLKSCDYYKEVFKKSKIPERICCDANYLPFQNNSIPFVFCYETLHHFPDPVPITKEIHRILTPGGTFFFDEEPYKKVLHINFYKGKKIYSKKSLNASKIRKILDYFFSAKTCNEVEYGIIENDDISVKTWRHALNIFEGKNIKLESLKIIRSELFDPKSYIHYMLSYLFGGRIYGACIKSGNIDRKTEAISKVLLCPACLEMGNEALLKEKSNLFTCPKCHHKFPVVDDVIFLLSHTKLEKLYPEIFRKIK